MADTDTLTALKAQRLIPTILSLRQRALDLEASFAGQIAAIDPSYQASARNLLHYLALRQVDLRPIQEELTALGLTSLGGCESHALSSLEAVLVALHALAGKTWQPLTSLDVPVDIRSGPQVLQEHSNLLLGPPAGKRSVRIMVTMPSEAATDYALVRDLLAAGMDLMRINCAHDSPEAWLGMIQNLRRAERELGRYCKVYADLAGPKLRTGPLQPAGRLLKVRPRRNVRGIVVEPARVWFTPTDAAEPAPSGLGSAVPVDRSVLEPAEPGDVLEVRDTRGKRRRFTVTAAQGHVSRVAEAVQTAYLETGMPIRLVKDGEVMAQGVIGPLPEVVEPIELAVGDTLVLTRDQTPGRQAVRNDRGEVVEPARIPCTLVEAFEVVQPGAIVRFDDGKIGARVLTNDGQQITVQITYTGPRAAQLRPEKGINFPDTVLPVSALTEKDRRDLDFLVAHVDVVGLSFVRSPEDVQLLEEELAARGGQHIGVVLKVETSQAFDSLPRLLLTAMQSPPVGVMVARGDLAVEVGFERLAEVQEEILWLCEAAHVPVIWATQVLEGLAKTGAPSRAEVSDAVMSGRAECVMLNKGPYIVQAVRFLNGVLERMHAHSQKRRAMLRRLNVSRVVGSDLT
ncbi:MAG: pyruvate kinase [Caldilineales bacterium]|nr:pyruvate kinase [Caldilineales bacterium]MDW8319448.1 pyruvate kinase [Anaerolineae bacterium]